MPPVKLETRAKLSLAVAASWAKRKQLKQGA